MSGHRLALIRCTIAARPQTPPPHSLDARICTHRSALVDCNYGESYVPLDWLMGTFFETEDAYIAAKANSAAKKSKKAA